MANRYIEHAGGWFPLEKRPDERCQGSGQIAAGHQADDGNTHCRYCDRWVGVEDEVAAAVEREREIFSELLTVSRSLDDAKAAYDERLDPVLDPTPDPVDEPVKGSR